MAKRALNKRQTRRYQFAGSKMYSDNTIQAAGQGSGNTTANIVYAENNPDILKAKQEALALSKQKAVTDSAALADEAAQTSEENKNLISEGLAEDQQGRNSAFTTAGKSLEYSQSEKFKNGVPGVLANHQAKKLAKQAATDGLRRGSGEIAKRLTGDVTKDALLSKTSSTFAKEGMESALDVMANYGAKQVATEGAKQVATEGVKQVATEGVKQVAEEGVSAAASSAGSYSTPYAAIANVAGTGVKMLGADDNDRTVNAAEIGGNMLSRAGEFAGYGSVFGPIGAAVGAGVGGGLGVAESLHDRNKARREWDSNERREDSQIEGDNSQLVRDMYANSTEAKIAELQSKTTSGYDLGTNTTAKTGGQRALPPFVNTGYGMEPCVDCEKAKPSPQMKAGGYMGIPQAQPVGDEGNYMARMQEAGFGRTDASEGASTENAPDFMLANPDTLGGVATANPDGLDFRSISQKLYGFENADASITNLAYAPIIAGGLQGLGLKTLAKQGVKKTAKTQLSNVQNTSRIDDLAYNLQRSVGKRNKTGGTRLPGGIAQSLPGGEHAEIYLGNEHDESGQGSESGILLDVDKDTRLERGGSNDVGTEVEDLETKDRIAGRDYFFSSDGKAKNGSTFAENHQSILNSNSSPGEKENQKHMLAQLQEQHYGRKPLANKPVNLAKNGGLRYQWGGVGGGGGGGNTTPFMSKSKKEPSGTYYKDPNSDAVYYLEGDGKGRRFKSEEEYMAHRKSNNLPADYSDVAGTQEASPEVEKGRAAEKAELKSESAPAASKPTTTSTSGSRSPSGRGNTFKVASDTYYDTEVYGDIADRQGSYVVDGQTFYAGSDDSAFRESLQDSEFRDNWIGNADPAVLEAAGITSLEDMKDADKVTAYQSSWNELHPDNTIKVDGKLGEQTWRTATGNTDEEEDEEEVVKEDDEGNMETVDKDDSSGTNEILEEGDDKLSQLAAMSQLLPAALASKQGPDYKKNNLMANIPPIFAERLAKSNLERVDLNSDKAIVGADAHAMNQFIDSSGGGSSNVINKMAAYSKKQQALGQVRSQELQANDAIRNQETVMDAQRKATNAQNALTASQVNVGNQKDVNVVNAAERSATETYNRDQDVRVKNRKLMALDTATSNLANMNRDRLSYDAQGRYTAAIAGNTGVDERANYQELLLKNNIDPNSDKGIEMMTTFNNRNDKPDKAQKGGFSSNGYKRRYF